jgi:diguanylate cyclase (GGDEF)-like protein/PAS domain S-box-containing protein
VSADVIEVARVAWPRAHTNIETAFLVAVIAIVFYVPKADGSAYWIAYDGLTTGAAAIAWIGVVRAPRYRRRSIALLAIGITSSALADIIYSAMNWTTDVASAVSVADVFWIGSYVALAAGVLHLIVSHDGQSRWDTDALIDLGVMFVVSFTVIWQTTLASLLADGSAPLFHRLVWAAYPVLDATLVVLVIRLVAGHRMRSWASLALAIGLGMWLVSDFVYLADSEATHWWLDSGWVVGAALMGYAVARLGAERPVARVEATRPDAVTPRRILLGLSPLLLPGAFMVFGYVRGDTTNPVPLFVATAVLAVFASVRAIRLDRRAVAARERLAEQERHYRALVANSADAVLVVDRQGRVTSTSGNLEGLVGSLAAEAVGTHVREVLRAANEGDAEATFLGAIVTPGIVFTLELEVLHTDGASRWLSARAVSLVDDPAVRGVVVNLHDITNQKQVEDELAHQAFHDSLTGLANRALFADRAEQALRRSARTADDPAVLYLDVDGFKKINDSLGHLVGDAVLNEIAARLAGSVRDGDTVGRLGGDEFAILIEGGGTTDAIAIATAERVQEALRDPVEAGGHRVRLSASVGICVADGQTSVTDLLRNADLAMYRAKARGKDQWILYEPEMSIDALKRLEMEADLIRAVERDQLVLEYQPVLDLGNETVVGFEALLRWHHPTLGVIPPDEFIPIAEENGMILPIGSWVLDTACAAAARWTREKQASLHIAVNVSGRQLGSEHLVGDVVDALERSGLPPSSLILEITETSLVREPTVAAARLRQLREVGVRLAIDDFGTGYSSLSYLRQFPVDILKIDRSFIETIGESERIPPLVQALLELGRTLDVEIVAEGIERQDQHDLLAGQACEFGQGFLFAKPLSEAAADAFIDSARVVADLERA